MNRVLDLTRRVLKSSFRVLLIVLAVALAYKLNLVCILICMVAGVIFNHFWQKEEVKRIRLLEKYKEGILYMEQMIYSFKKQPKIRMALLDAKKVGSNKIKDVINSVIEKIDNGVSNDIYADALTIIEDEYECKRIKSLHKFLVKIENHGGDYGSYIDILLQDIKDWNDRTLVFIKDVARVKRNVLISIFSTLITCGFIAYLVPSEYKYSSHIVYQLCSTAIIIFMFLAYYMVCKKMNIDWLKDEKSLTDNQVMRYYKIVEDGYADIKKLKFSERISYRKVKKRMERELLKYFPDWIREVAINLQNKTVQSAIEESYDKAPFVLKRPIRKLLIDFERYPVGIEPYDNLLVEFDLDEIKSSMKMFYSINELGKDEAKEQINSIIDRNNKLTSYAEEMKMKDKIGASSMYASIPMLAGVLKIMVDMVLMIVVFTSSIGNVLK